MTPDTPSGGTLALVVTQIATLITLAVNGWIARRKAEQQRRWDLEDRTAAEARSADIAAHVSNTGAKLAAAIADNTRKTEAGTAAAKDALAEANHTNDKIAAALTLRAWDGSTRALPAARIFVVDDNLISLKLTRLVLLGAGYVVETVMSAEEALEELTVKRRVLPDVILIDLNLPQMDGCTLARALRDKGFEMPLLAHTSFAADPQRCYDAGFDGFIEKSGDLDLLPRIVSQHLRIQRMQREEAEPLPPLPLHKEP